MTTLIGAIQSEANLYCQEKWLKHVKSLEGDFKLLIVDNCVDIDNYKNILDRVELVMRGDSRGTTAQRIVNNRNMILEYFHNEKQFNDLLLIDTDVFPPSSVLQELRSCDKDIVASVCWIVGKHTIKIAWNFEEEDAVEGNVEEWMKGVEPQKCYIREGAEVVEIPQTGMGCVLFKGDVIRKSNIMFQDTGSCNEDFDFIDQLRSQDYKAFINLRVNCFHDLTKFGGEIDGEINSEKEL